MSGYFNPYQQNAIWTTALGSSLSTVVDYTYSAIGGGGYTGPEAKPETPTQWLDRRIEETLWKYEL